MTVRLACLCIVAAVFSGWLAAQTPECPDSPATETMADGVSAYSAGQYAKAAELFQSATQLDPSCTQAWLSLGNSFLKQVVPGADTPDNREFADKARQQFETVLGQQPENEQALAAIASIYLQQKRWDDAKAWYEKLTVVNRENKEAFFNLGVIAWNRTSPALSAARARLGMKPTDPGPVKDGEVRQDLHAKYEPAIEEGIEDLKRAIELEAEFDEAMSYLNLLYREKADLEESAEE